MLIESPIKISSLHFTLFKKDVYLVPKEGGSFISTGQQGLWLAGLGNRVRSKMTRFCVATFVKIPIYSIFWTISRTFFHSLAAPATYIWVQHLYIKICIMSTYYLQL